MEFNFLTSLFLMGARFDLVLDGMLFIVSLSRDAGNAFSSRI
jgi:hypothetical protein